MSERKQVEEQSEELAVMAPALVETFAGLMRAIPEAETTEAIERIVAQILGAEEPEDLEEPWNGQGLSNLVGRVLRVTDVKRLPSDFKSGPGWYLGLYCTLVEAGESLFVTTGSISVLAQIGRAYQKGWLPLDVVARVPERPSKNGYYPVHLEIVGRPS